VLAPNMRFFVARHAKGVFEQAAYDSTGAEMCELRNYVIVNLLWDPSKDADNLIDEFLRLHYGKGAPPIKKFLTDLHDRTLASGKHPTFSGNADAFAINGEIGLIGVEAFKEAMSLAENDEFRGRIEKASIGAYRAALDPVWQRRRRRDVQKDQAPLTPEQVEKYKPLAEHFIRACTKHGTTSLGEGSLIGPTLQQMRETFDIKAE